MERERHADFWWENITKTGYYNNLGVDWTTILKWNLNEQDTKPWTGLTRIRGEITDGLVLKL
jgi:hypothetical protein